MMAPEKIYQIQAVARKNDLSLMYLFGSQAERGLNYLEGADVLPAENSDLDIAVAFRNPPMFPMETYGRLYREADVIFHPFDIDLIFMHEVDIFLQYEIIRGVRIYEADASLAELFEERIMKSAGDLVVKKRTMDYEIMEAIEDGYFQFESGSECIPRSLLRGKRASGEHNYSLWIEDSPQFTAEIFNIPRVLDLIRLIESYLSELRPFSSTTKEVFLSDKKNPPFVESYLRRSLEAVFDIGRHILAKTYGSKAVEYKAIAKELGEKGVITGELTDILIEMAGYRNRMVHFYKEVTPGEMYEIVTKHLPDFDRVIREFVSFIRTYEAKKGS